MLLLSGCTSDRVALVCPRLADPPPAAVAALEQAGRADPSTAAWVIDLDRHYSKLETCH